MCFCFSGQLNVRYRRDLDTTTLPAYSKYGLTVHPTKSRYCWMTTVLTVHHMDKWWQCGWCHMQSAFVMYRHVFQWCSEGLLRFCCVYFLLSGFMSYWTGQMSTAGHAWNGGVRQDHQWTEKVSLETACLYKNTFCFPVKFYTVFSQYSVVCREKRATDKRTLGFLSGSHHHYSPWNPWIFLFLWRIWTQSLYVCSPHGQR